MAPPVQPLRMAAPVLVSPAPLSAAASPAPIVEIPVLAGADQALVNPDVMPIGWPQHPQPVFQQHIMPVLYNEFTRSYFLPNGTPLVVADDVVDDDDIDVVTLDEMNTSEKVEAPITTQEELAAALAQLLRGDARLRQFMDANGGDPEEMSARAAAAMMNSKVCGNLFSVILFFLFYCK